MRNHQKSNKFKAGIAEFVGPLLKRLKLFKEQTPEMEEIINQISTEIEKTKLVIDSRENWDRELASCLGMIESKIDYWIDDKPSEKASDMSHKTTVTEVGESSNRSYHEKASDLSMKPTLSEFSMVEKYVKSLDHQELRCVYSLCLFPVNIKLKKRLLIYWWSSMGLVHTSSEMIDEIFIDLVDNGVLIPIRREHNNVIDHCIIEPTFHKQLISLCETKGFIRSEISEEGTWQLETDALLNLDQRYLNSKNIISSMHASWAALRVVQFGSWQCTEAEVRNGVEEAKSKETKSIDHIEVDETEFLKKLGAKVTYLREAIQFGSWQCTEAEVRNGVKEAKSKETKSIDHIEVDETEFLKKLGAKVTYLCMRGISRIEELHEPIGKLENLMILDLRACHNLEKLPQKPRPTLKQRLITWALSKKIIRQALPQESRWFEKLRVLDISECYLLGHMPNWVCELSNLEVLKGFVVSSVESKHQSCRLSDLPKLNKLRKLTIRIAIERLVPADLSGLKSMDNLLVLTIIWGGKKSDSTVPTFSLPKNLDKLDIRCYPETNASELLNPANLKKLKRLYIRGGKLVEIPFNDMWEVEILRLRFLADLEINWDLDIPRSFKNLKCVEYVGCPKLKNFPEASLWIKEKDEPFQGTNASGVGLNCELELNQNLEDYTIKRFQRGKDKLV